MLTPKGARPFTPLQPLVPNVRFFFFFFFFFWNDRSTAHGVQLPRYDFLEVVQWAIQPQGRIRVLARHSTNVVVA